MANIVFKLSDKDIATLMSRISFDTEQLPQGMKARSKYQNTTINIYNSGKVMFQGNNAETVANELLPNFSQVNTTNSTKKTNSKADIDITLNYNQYNCIGSDEAGSGDYFGPLTVCAAYVSKEHIPILKTLGVDDSKKLTDVKIVELAEQLVTFIPHSLLTLHNDKYNIQQAKGWTQVKMKAVLHNEAIKNVLDKIEPSELDYIVIDQFAKREVYSHYALSEVPLPKQTKFETKGESKSLAIAVASIISRYAFVTYMDQISKNINMTIPKGAGAKVDLVAAKIIKKYGISRLDTISKKHFKNREKAQKILKPL
ncbi:ribonuclease HIII [Staphylococcus aureus]|nr:ribonuclease HIII [Staphylococcus aureus]